MTVLTDVGIGAVSFVLLIVASWCVGEGGDILGKKYDASIVGGILIAWLNTAPEAIFFITALRSDNTPFAFGAMTGSTVVVCTIAVGCCLWVGYVCRSRKAVVILPSVRKQCWWLFGSALIPLSLSFVGFSSYVPLFVGVTTYLLFLLQSLQGGGEGSGAAKSPGSSVGGGDIEAGPSVVSGEETSGEGEDELSSDDDEEADEPISKGVIMLVAGGGLIFLFSSPFINSVVSLATTLAISPTMLAFFLAPVASEAPEILESISLARKGTTGAINVAFSNLIGGTVTKTTLLAGIFSFYGTHYGSIWDEDYPVGFAMLAFSALCASACGIFVRRLTDLHGQLLIGLFVLSSIIQIAVRN